MHLSGRPLLPERSLLLGLVALEHQLVSSEQLVAAFRAWRSNPSVSLSDILCSQCQLPPERMQAIEERLPNLMASAAADELPATTSVARSTPVGGDPFCTILPFRAATDLAAIAPGTDLAGAGARSGPLRYHPLRLHAAGGLGRVFEADDVELHRRVALKEIQPGHAGDADSRRRFVAEAEITGNLEHPGIVPVYGLGAYRDGRPFYAMRFIEGETLGEALKRFHREGPGDFASLAFRQLLARLVSVCNAVAFAHSRGIIHRDLKPQNIMLGRFGETLTVDWGLARPLKAGGESVGEAPWLLRFAAEMEGSDATATGEVLGTPAFMSPEQAAGRHSEVGPGSDIYSLGGILYTLLTGKAPLAGDIMEVLRSARAGHVQPPRAAQPRAPRTLDAICSKAMSVRPEDRYATALEMAADLERWLADEPTVAYREPWIDVALRWMRRHRLPIAVAFAVLLAAAIALAVGYVLVRRERDVAELERGRAVVAGQRARESAAATREVIDQFLIQVGDERWSELPGFEQVRLDMVQLAVERYRQLRLRQPDDASLRADAVRAWRHCANLYRMIGSYARAEELYDEAESELAAVVRAELDIARHQSQLGELLCDRAHLALRTKGPVAAESLMREALTTSTRARQQQSTLAARQVEARAKTGLADILGQLGRQEEALPLARQARDVLRAAATNSKNASSRLAAAYSSVFLGRLLRQAGQTRQSAAALDDASRFIRPLRDENSREANARFLLAWAILESALLADRNAERASNELDEATGELARLVAEFSRTSSFRRKLAEALTAVSRRRLASDDVAAASEAADRAVALLSQLDRDEDSPASFQELLADAYLAQAATCRARGDKTAAQAALRAARESLVKALAFNPASPTLGEQLRQIEAELREPGD